MTSSRGTLFLVYDGLSFFGNEGDFMLTSGGFQLADGQEWLFRATQSEADPWVRQLVDILGARSVELINPGQLLFFRRASLSDIADYVSGLGMKLSFPVTGWKETDFKVCRIAFHDDSPCILFDLGDFDPEDFELLKMSLSLYPVYVTTIRGGGMPLHAALIEKEGQGVVIAAAGGVGKSTCCQKLRGGWQWLCDDETLLVKTPGGDYHAHPFPTWSNLFCHREPRFFEIEPHLPLSAICFLEQARQDELIPIGSGQATALSYQISEQMCLKYLRYFDNELARAWRLQLFQAATGLSGAIPSYILRVSLTGHFWQLLDQVLLH